MLLLCNPSNEHGRLTSSLVSDQLFLFLTALLLSGVMRRPLEPAPAKPGYFPFNALSYVSIWGFGALLKGTSVGL